MTIGFARVGVLLLAGSAALPALAQSPYLVQDVDPAVAVGFVGKPRQFTRTAAALYALADAPTGRGLLRIDPSGSPALVRQVPDLPGGEIARVMTAAGETVFFTAQGGLWRSDGTPAGTITIKQFAWPSAGFRGPGAQIANVNGIVFFVVATGGVSELWKSDGTPAGTVRVASLLGGRAFTAAGNRLFFIGPGDGLWTSDGTEAGTVRLGSVVVRDVPGNLIPYGSDVLFIGQASGLGADLWRSDGTQAGTVRVKTFAPSFPHALTLFGNAALLAAGAPEGIWRTDGTDAGTTLVQADVAVRKIYDANGIAYIHGQNAATGREIWTTDGTPAGTAVLDYCPGPCNFLTLVNTDFGTVPGGVVFTRLGTGEIWRTDGTAGGIVPLGVFSVCDTGSSFGSFVPFGPYAYFSACTGGEQVWRTDGTTAGTTMIPMGTDGGSSRPAFAGAAGDVAIFAAARPDVGREIWSTAGTDSSTQLLADLTPGPLGSDWHGVASLGSLFTFTTVVSGGIDYLSSTDGSPAGTRPIGGGADPTKQAAVRDGLAIFSATGTLLPVRTDGSPEGTFAVPPPPGATSGGAIGAETNASHAGGFVMSMGQVSNLDGPQLWFTVDGRDQATRFALPVACEAVTSVADRLFLACNTGSIGANDLWISDGTYSGTSMLADLPGDLLPGWAALDGKLYFRVAGASGASLWSSDGTPAGTAPLSSIVTVASDPRGLTVSGGVLYFSGFTFEAGSELWRTDGTAPGTFMIRDFDPGPASGLAAEFESDSQIAAMSGGVVFTATTGTRGAELWFSDGTPAGTIPLAEIAPGPASSSPGTLVRAGDRIYLAADDGAHGREPWAIQLISPSVSIGDAVVDEGDTGTATASFTVRLDLPSGTVVTVPYTTVAGSAAAGNDFLPTSGTLTFGPGTRELAVDVAVQGDVSDETDESFALVLTSAAGAAIADGHGAGVIRDDDQPSVAVAGAAVLEGDIGPANASFPVTVTTEDGQPTAHVVALRGDVLPITAGLADFPPYNPTVWPTVSFPAGSPSGTTLPMLVPVQGDTLDEPNETYQLRVDGQHDAIVTAPAAGVIVDDDGIAAAAPVELAHGSTIVADLQPRPGQSEDIDFYVMQLDPASSHELVADGVSGDVAPIVVERVAADGSVVQTATPLGSGSAVSMRGFSSVAGGHIRVRGACAGACGADDTYRLRLYNTTLALPRVNNSGSQTTVLILQNLTSSTVNASVARWTGAGELAPLGAVTSHTIAPHGTAVVETDTSPGAAFTGSITVASDAPYGGLAGKAASIDPASGFSFDTPLRYRPR